MKCASSESLNTCTQHQLLELCDGEALDLFGVKCGFAGLVSVFCSLSRLSILVRTWGHTCLGGMSNERQPVDHDSDTRYWQWQINGAHSDGHALID